MRVIAYVDGFNLFYGSLKKTNYKWLDLELLINNISKTKPEKIKYFTAKIKPRGKQSDQDKIINQQIYLRALRTISNIEIIKGNFHVHEVRAKIVGKQGFEKVYKTEEKGTDVNIATHMIHDAHSGKFDLAILITNDSDLVEPVKIITQELNLKILLITPRANNNIQLKTFSSEIRKIREGVLRVSQFKDELQDSVGKFHKPKDW